MSTEHAPLAHYQQGLIVGKFAPLHLGHEWLIAQAAAQCDKLLILSYTKPEFARCEVQARQHWLTQRFPEHDVLVIDDSWLSTVCKSRHIETQLIPHNEECDAKQQHFLAWLLAHVVQLKPDALFCSEAYGPPTAAVLSRALGHKVQAVIVDLDRQTLPISASRIRQDPHGLSHWMAPVVQANFISRVVLLGGESSGKTTLAQALAKQFKTSWVPEYGRELWQQQNGVLSEADLLRIAHEQVHREEAALMTANRFLFCDTSPLTTLGYSGWMFGHAAPELQTLAERAYDRIILCEPDFPFVQDGTRRNEALFRLEQHAWYQQQLAHSSTPVLTVAGSLSQRVARVVAWLTVP